MEISGGTPKGEGENLTLTKLEAIPCLSHVQFSACLKQDECRNISFKTILLSTHLLMLKQTLQKTQHS